MTPGGGIVARGRLTAAANRAIIGMLGLGGILCILPALFMIAGVFVHHGHFSAQDIRAAFPDGQRFLTLLTNSLVVTAVSLLVSVLAGVPLGFLAFRTDLPWRQGMIACTVVAACVPLYIVVASWMAVLGQHFWLYSAPKAGWIMGMAYVPLVAALSGVAFSTMERTLEEQALLDADRGTVFLRVTIPHSAWAIACVGLAVIVLSMSLITVTDILMVRTFAEETLTQFQLSEKPWRAAATSLPAIAIVTALIGATALVLKHRDAWTLCSDGARPMVFPLGAARTPAALAVLLFATACAFLPVGFLVCAVHSPRDLIATYHVAASELWGSIHLSSLAATVCLCLAAPAAWTLSRMRRARWAIAAAIVLLVATPAPVVGIGIAYLLTHLPHLGGLYNSQAVLILAYVPRVVPFTVLALFPAIHQTPIDIEECAALDGCSWLRTMLCVVIPACWRGMLAAWLLSFVLCLSEIGASFIVVPPGRTTLTIRFFTLIHYGLYPDAAGICLILLGIVILPMILMAMLIWGTLRNRFC